jgi:hypothetical protein
MTMVVWFDTGGSVGGQVACHRTPGAAARAGGCGVSAAHATVHDRVPPTLLRPQLTSSAAPACTTGA